MTSTWRYTVLLGSALVLQRALFSNLRIGDAVADLLLVLAVAAGIAGGPERGAVVGFFSGLLLDLMLPTPMGLGALSYLLTAAAVGRLRAADPRAARWRLMALSGGGCAFGVVLFAVVGTLLGQDGFLTWHLLTVVVVVAVSGAVLGPAAVRLCRWANDDSDTFRPALR